MGRAFFLYTRSMMASRPRPPYARCPVYSSHIMMPNEKESTAVVSLEPTCGQWGGGSRRWGAGAGDRWGVQ